MVRKTCSLLGILLISSIQAAAPSGYNLRFGEEFDNVTSLSQTKFKFGFGWGTNSGAFSEQNREQNLSFENGCIVIKAEDDNGYRSAAINTKQNMVQKYGYWEVRAKIDKHVSGVLPAFWQKLVNESWPPELDIYEFFGTNPKQAVNVHWSDGGQKQSSLQKDIGSAAEFHVYGLEYTKDYIRWITDGAVIREITPSSHAKFFSQWSADNVYTMLNIHMTDKYAWLGSVDRSKLPVRMYVDYFRMYTKDAVTVTGPLTISREQPNRSTVHRILSGNAVRGMSLNLFDPTGRAKARNSARMAPVIIRNLSE